MEKELRFSANPDFDFEIRCVIGAAFSGGADIGEVLAAVQGIHPKDANGWFQAWLGLGDRVAAQADPAHPVSAASAHLRAATYYASAVNAVASLPDDAELLPTFRKHRAQWDAWVDAVLLPIERVQIPYEDSTLPGYFFRAPGVEGPAPTLVTINGSDGALTSLWSSAVSGAVRRGWNALVYDGPGQQSMLFEHGVPFRPDWEAVLTPVVDFLLARPDVDAGRLALYGTSQGGFWTPRALAFEHRFAAAVADPGVVDVSSSWTSHLPGSLRKLLASDEDEKFDREMELGMKFSKENASAWAFRARPYGKGGYAEVLHDVDAYRLSEEQAALIDTPLLITDPEHEQFWPGQAEQLAQWTGNVSTLIRFTAAEGADFHCEPLGRAVTEQRMFDWLEDRVSAPH
jgi:hypothetical protein